MWEAEKILEKRTRGREVQYLVEFKAWPVLEWDAAADISDDLVHEFEPLEVAADVVFHVPRPPAQAFVTPVAPSMDAQLALCLVLPFGQDIGRRAMQVLRHQRVSAHAKLLSRLTTCPPWLIIALREHFVAHAGGTLAPLRVAFTEGGARSSRTYTPTPHSSPPPCAQASCRSLCRPSPRFEASVRGGYDGKLVEDMFEITSTDIVQKVVGEFNTQGPGTSRTTR